MGATHAPRKFLKRQSLMFRYVTHIINGHIVTLLLTFTHTNAGLQHARSTCARVTFRHPPPRLAAEPAKALNSASNF